MHWLQERNKYELPVTRHFCGGWFFFCLAGDDIVYGLGGTNRGLNKRGYCYISDCTDDPNVNGEQIRHDKVHNLFGCNMTRAAGEAFKPGVFWCFLVLPMWGCTAMVVSGSETISPGGRTCSWIWRWCQPWICAVFCTQERIGDFKGIIETRYRLIPYLYSEYMQAALSNDLYFKPLSFVYPDDKIALWVEEQMMIGNEIIIAPVYTQNARGRYVYLSGEMKFVEFPKGKVCRRSTGTGTSLCGSGSGWSSVVDSNGQMYFDRKGCAAREAIWIDYRQVIFFGVVFAEKVHNISFFDVINQIVLVGRLL